MRGSLELATDDVEGRLGGLWDLVERRLDADPPAGTSSSRMPAVRAPGAWARLVRWLDSHRGHLLTGALSAGAVAAIALLLRTDPQIKVIERQVQVPGPVGPVTPAMLQATPPEVESLDVSGGTGTVFTIEDDDGGSDTAVIWVTPDDVMEGI